MAERKPLVLINGQMQELPVGDTLPGSGAGGVQNNFAATAAPSVNNDITEGYEVGSRWVDITNDNSYTCADATDGAAVWLQENGAGGGGSMTDAEVKTAYENNANTNAFTDALLSKLSNIEANAKDDQTGTEIVAAIDAELGQTDWKTGGGGGSTPTPETPTTLNLGVGGGSNTAGESIKGNIFTMTETRYLTGVLMPITNNATYTYRFVVVEIDYSNPTVSQPVTVILYRSPSLQIFNTGDADFIEHFKVPIKLESGKTYGICGESLTGFRVRGKAVSGLDNVIDQQGFTYVGRVRENLSGPCVVGSDLRDHVNNTTMTMTYYSVSENALVADTYGGVIYGDQDVDFDVTDEMLSGNHQIDLWSGVTTITVPPSLTGTEPVTFTQLGAADISFVAGSGVTINSLNGNLKLAGQYGAAVLVPKGNDTFSLIGDLKA